MSKLITIVFIFLNINIYSQYFKTINNIEGLTSKNIYDIEFDKNGTLWICTYGSGLYSYDGNNLKQYLDTAVGANRSRTIYVDSSIILSGTANDVYIIKGQSIKSIACFKENQQVTCIRKINKNDYLITTTLGLYRYKNDVVVPIDVEALALKEKRITYSIIKNERNSQYYITSQKGLFKLSNDLSKIYPISFNNYKSYRCSRGVFLNDTLYLTTSFGLALIKNDKLVKVYNDSLFGSNSITHVFKPKNKSYLWLFLKGQMIKFQNGKIIEKFDVQDGLPNFEVSKVLEDKDGNFILAFREGGGLCYFIENYIYKYNVGIINNFFKVSDTLSYYSNKHIIALLNFKTKKSTKVVDFETLNLKGIKKFVVDSRSVVWVYLESNLLLGIKDNKVIKTINFNLIHTKPVLSNLYITSKDRLYIGFYNGAEFIDLKNYKVNKVKFWSNKFKTNNVFSSYVHGFKEIDSTVYMFSGYNLFNSTHNDSIFYLKNELIRGVNTLEKDYKGNIWFWNDADFYLYKNVELHSFKNNIKFPVLEITNTSIFKENLIGYSDAAIYVFNINSYYNTGKLSGIKFKFDKTFNVNYITTTSNFTDKFGNLYFGTESGIVKFNFIDALNKKRFIKLKLTNLLLNYEKVDWNLLDFKTENNVPINPKFKHYQNNLTFQLSNLNFFNSDDLQYQYKLIGIDTNYSAPSSNNQINYSNLAFGKYEFRVKATREGFDSSTDILSYKFEILPAFYQTIWFKLLVIVLIVLIVIFVFKYRTKQIKERNKHLEKLVNQKTRLLSDKITEVTELYNQIKTKNLTINESIEYAKYIQGSILKLNTTTTINSKICIKEIIYMPKDIIGGDFYMIFNHNNLDFIIMADCTGHGVPGALLTVLCKSLLNQIILYDNICVPDLILKKLNELLWNTFSSQENANSDSLAISILVLDYEKDTLTCSSSQQPFLIKSKLGDIEFVKIDSSPLNSDPKTAIYNVMEFSISNYKNILLYSDGIIDQQGQLNSKKLYSSGIKKWFTDINDSDLYKNKLMDFKGNVAQRDDITLINIHFKD